MIRIMRKLFGSIMRLGGRRAFDATLRVASNTAFQTALRAGGQSALDSAVGAAIDVVPRASQAYTQVFSVEPPLTVYMRASHCRVMVQRHDAPKVILQATMARAFGVELAADQDEAGVYIVARRKNLVGQMARIEVTLTVPHACHLAFNLTPGDVVLQNIEGLLELPQYPTPTTDLDT